jgi:peptidoglycan-associated lipoprotein
VAVEKEDGMTKKIWFAALGIAVLVGCSSQSTKDEGKAGVEDRTPAAVQPAPAQPPVSTKPVQPAQVEANPLKDPKNILSKRSVFFEYDSDRIRDEFRPLLQAHGRYLSQNANAKMLIQGNCDERGSREYNIALGQKRADGVKKLLLLMGAKESQLESVSLGEEKPRCTDKSEDCYSQNRRSDMLYGGEY